VGPDVRNRLAAPDQVTVSAWRVVVPLHNRRRFRETGYLRAGRRGCTAMPDLGQFPDGETEHLLHEARAGALRFPTWFSHLSLFLMPLRPVATGPAVESDELGSSRNRLLRLISAGVRPCDSSHRLKPECEPCFLTAEFPTRTEVVVWPRPIALTQSFSRKTAAPGSPLRKLNPQVTPTACSHPRRSVHDTVYTRSPTSCWQFLV
jgi:hypothetical protein